LTWKCASRHNGVHFFDIATSKSGPTMVCFAHFDFKTLKIEKASNSGFQPKIKAASLKSPCCTSPKTKLLALNQGWKLCFEAGKCRLAALILS